MWEYGNVKHLARSSVVIVESTRLSVSLSISSRAINAHCIAPPASRNEFKLKRFRYKYLQRYEIRENWKPAILGRGCFIKSLYGLRGERPRILRLILSRSRAFYSFLAHFDGAETILGWDLSTCQTFSSPWESLKLFRFYLKLIYPMCCVGLNTLHLAEFYCKCFPFQFLSNSILNFIFHHQQIILKFSVFSTSDFIFISIKFLSQIKDS